MIGDCEWQPCDDDVRKSVARHVHAHPKTVRPKKNTAWCRLEFFEQTPARHTSTLNQKIHLFLHEKFLHSRRNLLHTAVTGEKDKGASIGFFDKMTDPIRHRFVALRIA